MTDSKLTRRHLVGTALATGAAAALPEAAQARTVKHRKKVVRRTRKADFVVVGAGFAGLTAAREIVKAGRSVVVLEARGRVGGRVENHDLGNGKVSERGGTFIGPTQDHMYDLCKQYGIGLFDTYDTGNNVYINGSDRQEWSDTGPTGTAPPDPALLPDLALIVQNLDQMSTQVPVDAPWTAASAADWDSQTLATYVKQNAINPDFNKLLPVATRPIFGAEASELSLLFVLFYIASSGDERNPGTFERNFNTRGGGQQSRLVGGSQLLPLKMAADLGRRVVLNSPVRRIEQLKGGVRVTSDKLTVNAKRVIVAVPPTLAGGIDYRPDVPMERDALTRRVPQGTLVKVAAVYDKPFWREKGYNGTGLRVDGLVNATFDDSPPDGNPGVVFGFVGGDSARRFRTLSEADKRSTVLNEFAAFWGSEALQAKDFFYTDWGTEAWSRGCPVGIYAPGTLLPYGPALRKPVGRVHWAGTETSNYWNGYMEGAVRSGLRAAAEVLAG
jgi:monoamine oxidase